MSRVRRPLIALVVLVALLVGGYILRACDDGGSRPRPSGAMTTMEQ